MLFDGLWRADVVTQLSNTVEEQTKRLENTEARVLHRISELDPFPTLTSTSGVPVVTPAVQSTNEASVPSATTGHSRVTSLRMQLQAGVGLSRP